MKLTDINVLDLATNPRTSLPDNVGFFFYRYVTLFTVADSTGARAKKALAEGGRKVGQQLVQGMFYRSMFDLVEHFKQHGLGILEVEEEEEGRKLVRLRECATCAGLPPVEMPLCWFDGGVLAGAIGAMQGEDPAAPWQAEEIECAGLGHPTCLFEIRPTPPEEA